MPGPTQSHDDCPPLVSDEITEDWYTKQMAQLNRDVMALIYGPLLPSCPE